MKTTYRTMFDDIVGVYDKAVFEQRARERGYTRRTWGVFALLAIAIATVLLAGAVGLFTVAAKQLYLDVYGTETLGRVVDVSTRANTFGRKTVWKTVIYEFTTPQGETIEAKLDRPVSELTNLPDRNHFMIAYWERFPSISSPRGVQTNAAVFLAPLYLLFGIHFALWSKRLIDWRRTLVRPDAVAG